jgi:PadR family transcriptional regulator
MTGHSPFHSSEAATRVGMGVWGVFHQVFKTGRAGQPPAWKVRFLRRVVAEPTAWHVPALVGECRVPRSGGPRAAAARRASGHESEYGSGRSLAWTAECSLAMRPIVCVCVRALRCKGYGAIMRCMANESRRSQMLRGVLDLCLLAVLDEGPAYGYEMTRRLHDHGLPSVGEGSIYPLLGRLEREGLVETYRAASNGGPPRKYYRPSSAGRVALALGVSEWRAARDAIDAVLAPVKIEVAL